MQTTIEPDLSMTPLIEPAKRWRNWMWLSSPSRIDPGRVVGPGKVAGARVWPSKDLAETASQIWFDNNTPRLVQYGIEARYLGAHPDEESP